MRLDKAEPWATATAKATAKANYSHVGSFMFSNQGYKVQVVVITHVGDLMLVIAFGPFGV